MAFSFSDKGRAAVLDRPADISRSGILELFEGVKRPKCNPVFKSELRANDLIMPTCPTLYLSCFLL